MGSLSAGAVTELSHDGWRYIFWIQAACHGALVLMLLFFYYPPKRSDYPKMRPMEYLWSLNPIGCFLFVTGGLLVILALDWTGGTYAWGDAHVGAPLGIGLALLVGFCVYGKDPLADFEDLHVTEFDAEWKGRTDGIVAHVSDNRAYSRLNKTKVFVQVLFSKGYNFPLATFAFAVEGWIFYSAVNSITPQIVLNLGWASTSFEISVRQLSFQISAICFSVVMVYV